LGSKTSKLDIEGFMWAVSTHVRVEIQNVVETEGRDYFRGLCKGRRIIFKWKLMI